jgi:hypothetical protein
MHPGFDAPDWQPLSQSDIARLPALLRQAATELDDPAVACLLARRYYERTNHPRGRHCPAVFAPGSSCLHPFFRPPGRCVDDGLERILS